jgi:IS5 family transposase
VVETNIHYPTVDALIADGVRLISPLVSRAKELIPHSVCQAAKAEPFRNRTPSAKRSAHKISKMALGRTQEAKATYRAAYQRLVEVARSSIKQAERVRSMLEVQMPSAAKISEEISHFAGLLKRAVWQTHPRVFEGEQLPATEKLLSIFESHTTIIRRGKARKQTEFGRKVWLSEVDGGIISGFRILEGNAGDEAQLKPALDDHLRLFGKPPELVAADRNVHSKENERLAKGFGVKKVCLPKEQARRVRSARRARAAKAVLKRARRFRAGIEGRISVMKRGEYLGRCRDKGEEGFGRWVGRAEGKPGHPRCLLRGWLR